VSPFRVPPGRRNAIGENGLEQARVEPGGSDGAGEGGQPAIDRSSGDEGGELAAEQADLGAVSGGWSEGAAAWQLWAGIESGVRNGVSGGGGSAAALDRTLGGAAGALHGLEERVCASAQCPGAHARRAGGYAVRTHVREVRHRDHRRQFTASQRASGASARHASGPAGEETAPGRDRQL